VDCLYLDYDGTLFPFPGPANFLGAEVLADLLWQYSGLKIVLSTTWVISHGLERASAHLPPALRDRVIGATFNSQMDREIFEATPRHAQIFADVLRRKPARWLALDDDAEDWPETELFHLVAVPPTLGLACREARKALKRALRETFHT
jgi:hypothetical protein